MNTYYGQKVKAVEVLGEFRIKVVFADDFTASIDLAPLLECGPIFAPLRDVEFFKQVQVSLEWGGWSGRMRSIFRQEVCGHGVRPANL